MSILKSSRAKYLFISDDGFIKRNVYFFKQRIQIFSVKQPVNIEIYLQFLDYRKVLSTSIYIFYSDYVKLQTTSKMCKSTRVFVQVYISFYSFQFKLEMMNIIIPQLTNILTKCHERKKKRYRLFLVERMTQNLVFLSLSKFALKFMCGIILGSASRACCLLKSTEICM